MYYNTKCIEYIKCIIVDNIDFHNLNYNNGWVTQCEQLR